MGYYQVSYYQVGYFTLQFSLIAITDIRGYINGTVSVLGIIDHHLVNNGNLILHIYNSIC